MNNWYTIIHDYYEDLSAGSFCHLAVQVTHQWYQSSKGTKSVPLELTTVHAIDENVIEKGNDGNVISLD